MGEVFWSARHGTRAGVLFLETGLVRRPFFVNVRTALLYLSGTRFKNLLGADEISRAMACFCGTCSRGVHFEPMFVFPSLFSGHRGHLP